MIRYSPLNPTISSVSVQHNSAESTESFVGWGQASTPTAYLLSQGGLRSPKLTRHDMLRFNDSSRVPSHGHLLNIIPILKKYSNFKHET